MSAQTGFDPQACQPRHFRWSQKDRVGVVTPDRPECSNPLAFESYAELRDLFRSLRTTHAKTAFLSTRVGLAGCDLGACAIRPRIVAFGRAHETFIAKRKPRFEGD